MSYHSNTFNSNSVDDSLLGSMILNENVKTAGRKKYLSSRKKGETASLFHITQLKTGLIGRIIRCEIMDTINSWVLNLAFLYIYSYWRNNLNLGGISFCNNTLQCQNRNIILDRMYWSAFLGMFYPYFSCRSIV